MLRMAIPIMFGVFAQSIVMFIDSSFLSRVGALEFDAAGNAALLYITCYMVGLGMADGGQITIARRIGEGHLLQSGATWRATAITLFGVIIILFILLHLLLVPWIPDITQDQLLAKHMAVFLTERSYGLGFAFINLAATAILAASGRTSILLVSTVVMAGVNIFLDYAMIFGHYGFEPMGLKGAARATVIAEGFAAAVLVIYLIRSNYFKQFQLFGKSLIPKKAWIKLITISVPLMFQGLLAVGGWTAYFMMIEKMGPHDLEVSQVVHKLYFLALIPIIGFSSVTKTYVSQILAEGDIKKLMKALKRIFILTILSLVVFIHGNVIYPEALASLVNGHEYLFHDVTQIQLLIVGSILVHGTAIVLVNIISGSGNTRFSLLVEFLSLSIYLWYSYMIIMIWKKDVVWVWSAEYVYFICMAIFCVIYLRTGRWKKKKV